MEKMEENIEEILAKLFASKTGQESVNFLHDEYFSEWQLFLEKATERNKGGNTALILKIVEIVATKVLNSESESASVDIGEKVGKILTVTCGNSKFIDSIETTVIGLSTKQENPEIFGKFLENLHIFCLEVLERIPYLGKDVLLNLICTCIGAVVSNSKFLCTHQDLLGQFTSLQQKVREITKTFEDERKPRKRYEFDEEHELHLHSMQPPEDFRGIPIIPTLDELINEKDPFLRPNMVKGPYRSSEHYLDVQFRLLREDFVLPLRRAVQDFMKNKEEFIKSIGKRRTNREQDSTVRLYSDVTFHGTEWSRNNTTDYLFNLPQRLASRVNWDKSKRLLPGCLVMLTSDYCKTATFAITLPPKQKNTKGGDPRRQELADGILRLTIETGKEFILENKSYLMFECESFFEAYRYNLGILQSFQFPENDGPEPNLMNNFIVQASFHVGHPSYLRRLNIEYRLPASMTLHLNPLRPDLWPSEEIQTQMGLDPDQYEAVKCALTSELAVIQGPPGTGKTYVGLQIVKTLILNKKLKMLPPSPFLVLCYTNHALDQFLELLLLDTPKLEVVRVGGQSKSDVVSDHSLFQHRKRLQKDWDHPRFEGDVREQKAKEHAAFRTVKDLEERLGKLALEISELSCPTGIFDFVDTDLLSKSNRFEADFLLGLCEYLLKQGYTHKQITILTTYNGQMFLLKKLIPDFCRGVRITCVDNFQGEENDIILLSLVRSNKENKVGFVGKENRICVALSRARHGLYVVGNMDGLRSASETWKEIGKKLISGENIGTALELVCKRHKKVTLAKSREDFQPLVNGGCDQICNVQLNCGHICPKICHTEDQTHENYNCMERCSKSCTSGHPCIAICSSKCPSCLVPVSKSLQCGHPQTVACHVDPKNAMCETSVLKQLPCEHEIYMKCYQDAANFQCTFLVEKILNCGHVRMIECYISPENYECEFEEEKVLSCGHIRKMKCFQKIEGVKCDEMIEKELPCGHKKILKCCKTVNAKMCDIIVEVIIPECSHVMKLPCSNSANSQCTAKCEKILSCGHVCTLICHTHKDPNHEEYKCKIQCARSCSSGHACQYPHDCHTKCLPCTVFMQISFDCEHTAEVECSKNNGENRCRKKVTKTLPCGHEQLVGCSVSPEQHKCTFYVTKCQKECTFGHRCSFEHACHEGCPPCNELVKKTLKCGHDGMLCCHEDETIHKCTEILEIECRECKKEVPAQCWNNDSGRFICELCVKPPIVLPPPQPRRYNRRGDTGYYRKSGSRYYKDYY